MRIGIDCYEALGLRRNFSEGLLTLTEALADEFPDVDFYLYVPSLKAKNKIVDSLVAAHNIRVCLPPPSGFGGTLWRLFGITNNLGPDKIDLFFGESGILPLNIENAKIPSVLLSENIERVGKPFSLFSIKRFSLYLKKKNLESASAVIVSSEEERDCLNRLAEIDLNKIHIIPKQLKPGEKAKELMHIFNDLRNQMKQEIKD